jgi:pyruvate dehydrogenase E1 component alpha subunit
MATAQREVAVVPDDDGAGRQLSDHDHEQLLTYYREMLLIRRFEEKAGQLYGMGLIGGFCHLYIGQEAVAVGVQHALREGDSVITAYRDHGHMLVTGMDPRRVMAELTGRVTGYSKGKGGSMHMFARDKHFYGGHGIVGACVPLGTGIAFAHQYRADGGVCVTYLGDGAVNQGQVYEAFNMAALWKLPVVYVIENNQYGMGTSVQRASASTELYRRGEAYGIQGRPVDGMDVLAVREAAAAAVALARTEGPTIVEALTYRYRGHSMSDPAKYRSRQEVQEVRAERDPIDRLRKTILENGLADENAFKTIDKDIRAIVNEAASFAQDSPEPDPAELYTDVYRDA